MFLHDMLPVAGKQGPWTQYPKRMRQMRARAFALRDVFADILKGMPIAEELQDYPVSDRPASGAQAMEALPALEQYSDDDFNKNFPTYKAAIEAGRKTPETIINTLSTKFVLSDDQKEKINAVKKADITEVNK